MNGKFEEKLSALAFGDLSPDEAKRIEAQALADPEAARTLNLYRSMRTGLKDMHDVPEDQMSKERLRDAILAQGLKPKPERATSPLGWLWMPAAAAVFAAAFMLMRGGPETQVVLGPDALPDQRVAIRDTHSDDLLPNDLESNVTSSVTTDAVVSNRKESSPEVKPTRRSSTVAKRPKPVANKPEVKGSTIEFVKFEDAPKFSSYVATNDRPKPDLTAMPDNSYSVDGGVSDAAPIVIIEENRDTTTGAFKATEVGASNVLIGG